MAFKPLMFASAIGAASSGSATQIAMGVVQRNTLFNRRRPRSRSQSSPTHSVSQSIDAEHTMKEIDRVTETVRIENPNDPSQYVLVGRVTERLLEDENGIRHRVFRSYSD